MVDKQLTHMEWYINTASQWEKTENVNRFLYPRFWFRNPTVMDIRMGWIGGDLDWSWAGYGFDATSADYGLIHTYPEYNPGSSTEPYP
jgi:hypothetical protein